MIKVVLKLDMHDDKIKQKAMKTVSGLAGVESIAMDATDKKLTVMGDIDPVKVAAKLRKFCHTEILSVGPEKKKDEGKKDEGPKKEDVKKDATDDVAQFMKAYQYHPAYYQQLHYQYPAPMTYYRTVEQDPNACVIC